MGFGKDNSGIILYDRITISPAALVALDLAKTDSAITLAEDFRILRMDYWVDYGPQAAGDIILFGVADGALTAAEIEEALEARAGDSNDVPETEQSMRAVWPLEIMGENSAGSGSPSLGTKGSINLKWTFKDPDGWTFWLYNTDSANPLTTGSKLSVITKIFGVWVV